MGTSTNTGQHPSTRLSGRLETTWRLSLASELRRRRIALGLSQARLGDPLTRAFVSGVERGLIIPSLPALRVMVERMQIPMSEFFEGVEAAVVDRHLTGRYDVGHEGDDEPDHDP